MVVKIKFAVLLMLLSLPITVQAAAFDNNQLSVWANEAIVATYSYNYKNFLEQQKVIAKYFTAAGWTSFSTALQTAKLPELVQSNSYYVNSVAMLPPEIKRLGNNEWQATMPLLVVYKNPQYQQKQTLAVTIRFIETSPGQGVRGLSIISLQSKVISPPCQCTNEKENGPEATQAP